MVIPHARATCCGAASPSALRGVCPGTQWARQAGSAQKAREAPVGRTRSSRRQREAAAHSVLLTPALGQRGGCARNLLPPRACGLTRGLTRRHGQPRTRPERPSPLSPTAQPPPRDHASQDEGPPHRVRPGPPRSAAQLRSHTLTLEAPPQTPRRQWHTHTHTLPSGRRRPLWGCPSAARASHRHEAVRVPGAP